MVAGFLSTMAKMTSSLTLLGLILASVMAGNTAPAPQKNSRIFDLRQCYQLALERGETIGLSDAEVAAAQARYWNSVGAIFPQIKFLTTERLQNNSSSGSSTGGTSSSGARKDQLQSSLNLQVPLFTGFREYYNASAGKADLESRKFSRTRTRQLLYLDVADVFYQIRAYEKDLQIQEEIRQALLQREQELHRRIKLGRSRLGELRTSEVERVNTEVSIEQTKGLLAASRELLAFLINFPSSEWELSDHNPLPEPSKLEFYLSSLGERPDVQAAVESSRAARKRLSSARSERLPTIDLDANYYVYQSPSSKQDWNLFLNFSLPVFDAGQIETAISEKKALLRSSELNLEQLKRSVDRDVRTAYSDFIAASAQVVKLREAERLSSENYALQQQDYTYGIVNNLDVLNALRQLHDARRALLTSDRDARVNVVRLHVAAGVGP